MKRIVLCADGTWNEAEKNDPESGRPQPTNVLKTARGVLPRSRTGVEQVLYYHYGVGTGGGLDKVTGGAFGEGIELNVRMLYRFLVYNFEPGDEIYLFGFSRGAFTVRTLAGFMNYVGLLEKDDEYYTGKIWGLYEKGIVQDSPEWRDAFKRIRDTRVCPPIRFIGVWDTVGSLGAPGAIGQLFNRDKYKYHDIELHPQVERAYHALAIDERRKPFKPSLWTRPAGWSGLLEQAWFAGVHSNIGGSYHPDGLANEALHWILGKAEEAGLAFNGDFLAHYRPCFDSTLNDSMTAMYRVMGPFERQLGEHRGDGEMIHRSVLDRMNHAPSMYAPPNVVKCLNQQMLPIAETTRIARGTPCGPVPATSAAKPVAENALGG